MVHNKLPPQAPPTFAGTSTSILEDAQRLVERSRKVQDQVIENVQPGGATFANVLLPLAHAANAVAKDANILGFYRDVSIDPELRDASSKAQKLLKDFAMETAMNEELFNLIAAVVKKNEDLDRESRHLLHKEYRDCVRNGLQLPVESRDHFKEIQKRLVQLQIEFRRNQLEADSSIWVTPQEMEGVPEDVISELEEGKGKDAGKLRLGFAHLFLTLSYATNSETRKRILIAHENKSPQNVPLFKETVVLRDEAARLLGYPNHATLSIEDKMARGPEAVNSFLNDLRTGVAASGQRDIEKLKQLKKLDCESRGEFFDGQYYLWDYAFYNRLMVEKEYSIDQQKIAEYFPLQTTFQGMLETFQHLFALVFVEITSEERNKDIVWHQDVQLFAVWDDEQQGGHFVGYLYVDLFSREGKYGHPSCFSLQPGFLQEDGTRRYPATGLLCSFPKATSTKPSLLQHNELVVLFHELGHSIHDIVSKTKYARFHGINVVVDFGEAPSQMLENWCWTPSILKSFSKHYSSLSSDYFATWTEHSSGKSSPPGERIPDEMIKGLVRTRLMNRALFALRQLQLSIFDMTIYAPKSHEAIENLNFTAEYNRLRKEITQISGPEASGEGFEWGHGHANIAPIIHEYDAGYYSYLSSNVYSSDIFHNFFKSDPMNAEEGRRYRYTLLEKGGSQDEMQTLIEYLGREPETEAFYQELGLF